jgi:hypothetical protein
MKRTQIYLSEEQWRDLSRHARIERASVAELIRRAVDQTYRAERLSPAALEAWTALAGLWADRRDLPDAVEHVNALRQDDRIERVTGARPTKRRPSGS